MKNKTGMEQVRDALGKLVGFVNENPSRDIVCKPTGTAEGFCQNGGTFDNVGRRILTSEQPSWLLGKNDKIK